MEILIPIEINAMKSIVVRHIDKMIVDYEDEEIIESINRLNDCSEAEEIYRIAANGRLLKIKFQNTNMVERAVREGIIILNQKVPGKYVEKEICVKLNPCYNCFSYMHKTKDCTQDKMILCAYCGAEDHK